MSIDAGIKVLLSINHNLFIFKNWNMYHFFFYFVHQSNNLIGNVHLHASSPLPEPIGKGRSSSTSSSITSDSGFYQRAPGSEREDSQMVSVSRNLDDTSHRHLMFLMASIFAQLFKSESVLLTEYECVNYEVLAMDSGGNLSFCWFHGNFIDNKKKILLYTIHYFTCMVQCFTCFKLHGLFLIENQNAYF